MEAKDDVTKWFKEEYVTCTNPPTLWKILVAFAIWRDQQQLEKTERHVAKHPECGDCAFIKELLCHSQ